MVVVAMATKKQRTRYIQLQQGEHEVSAPTADCRWSVVDQRCGGGGSGGGGIVVVSQEACEWV